MNVHRWTLPRCAALLSIALLLTGCPRLQAEPPAREYAEPWTEPAVPSALPTRAQLDAVVQNRFAPLPDVGEVDREKVALGRRLFHDPALSRDGTVACASCHVLERGGADGRRTSLGIGGQRGPVNAPTVLNARFNVAQFWDGRAADLAEQVGGPITNPREMGNDWRTVVATLTRDASYREAFRRSYRDGITAANVRDAIATYESILVTPSRFDRYLRGETDALTAREREGAGLFAQFGCVMCHQGVNVGGQIFQRMGVYRDYFADRGEVTEADLGRFNVTRQPVDRHVFKVPSLRNAALTAPYFHDGSATTLEEAVRTMARYQLDRTLRDDEVALLVAFLGTLTGELPAAARTTTPE
jgi:cytochrome c peroxidase